MKIYTLGQTIRLDASLRDEDDAVIEPTGMRLLLFGPADNVGQIISTNPDPDDANLLYAEVSPSTAGVWRWRWEVPSGTKAAREGAFQVVARTVPPPA
jgi:hypothetical protein